MILAQIGGALPATPWELVTTSSNDIKIVLIVLAFFSVVSWFLIVLKWRQFRRVAIFAGSTALRAVFRWSGVRRG